MKKPRAPAQPKTPASVAGGHSGSRVRKAPAKPMSPKAYKQYLTYLKAHHKTTKAKTAKPASHHKTAKPRKWSPDSGVALCSARALAESLRLALGVAVDDAAVLGLYWRTASDPDAGASILATLMAVQEYGLDGRRPVRFECVGGDGFEDVGEVGVFGEAGIGLAAGVPHTGILIAGLDMITPHAAVAHAGTWWSWGEPWQPPAGAVIEETWIVDWG